KFRPLRRVVDLLPRESRLALLRRARLTRLVNDIGMLAISDPDTTLECERLSASADVVAGECLDPAAELVGSLRHRREAYPERIEHARLANTVDTYDEVESRLEVEFGGLDSAEV